MHNFLGIKYKVDNFRKGVFTDPYDEPTFLTFALDFKFEDTRSSVDGGDSYLWSSPLFIESKGGAIDFLESRNYTSDANSLKVFKEILRYLTFDAPWYFQSITGLDKMWLGATQTASGYKAKGVELTVETLEAVDLRITELASIYRKCAYDKVYMREKIPDNLQWFAMDIYIAEARNIRYRLPGISQNTAQLFGVNTASLGNILGAGNILSNVIEQYGYVKFKCRQCQFDFSNSFAGGSKMEVTTGNKPATNSFKIKVGYFEEETSFADGSKIYDDLTRTYVEDPWSSRNVGTDIKNIGSFLSGLPLIGNDIQRAGQKVQNTFAQVGGLLNPALGAASQFIEPPVTSIGNVYR